MNGQSDLALAGRALEDLARVARILPELFGATLDVRRVVDDVHRLRNSLSMLGEAVMPPKIMENPRELEVIPDHEHDLHFWLDADHEGIGGMASFDRLP
jgi:hypothetical protein